MNRSRTVFLLIFVLTLLSLFIALPQSFSFSFHQFGLHIDQEVTLPVLDVTILGKRINPQYQLKQGLDIQGGMEVVLQPDMSQIPEADRQTALESAQEIIRRRVDLYGISEPTITTSQNADQYRLLVDLPGVKDPNQALQLVGQTAQLDFRLQSTESAALSTATESAIAFFEQFQPSGLTGQQLNRATVQFNQQTAEPEIKLEFDDEGRQLFADITQQHVGQILAIFIDDYPVALPQINTPILDGVAVMTGGFELEEARQLVIQLNAGALPVPISVIEQRQLGASLGQTAVAQSVRAGAIGIGLVMLFMVLLYGWKGVIADWALIIYGILTVAVYKVAGVTLTIPGIAGLLLSIGMAVDSNILIFERMKEELRLNKPWNRAMELGFGRAWDSIKDANVATIVTALVLINPLNFPFLATSGMVRGFGITLLIGVMISLFTGVVVTRTLMRLFLRE